MNARTKHVCIALALVAAACLTQVTGVQAVQNDTILISKVGLYGPAGNAFSAQPSLSADGRYVAFDSLASNFPGNGGNVVFDVFLRDRVENTLTLVSRPTDEATGAGNDASSLNSIISADGRFVAFESQSNNMSAFDNDNFRNVYVRDVIQGTTTLVSQPNGTTGGTANNENSFAPSLSADGRYIAFQSNSDNITTDDNDNNIDNIYVRDQVANTTTLVSRPVGADGQGNDGHSQLPKISADGRFVTFESSSNNLSDEDNNNFENVFVRDLTTDSTVLVSRPTTGDALLSDGDASAPAISADGRAVTFHSQSNILSDQDNDAVNNVYIRDLDAGTTTLVSRPSGQNGLGNNDHSVLAAISADGRYVAFQSDDDHLSTLDHDSRTDIFVHDVVESTTVLVSAPSGNPSGAGNTAASLDAAVSGDGRFVAFYSAANNLSTEDDDSQTDVFMRDVLGTVPPPSLSVSDVSAKEGKTGTTTFTFTVTLEGTPARPVTVDFATRDVTANRGSDYQRTGGTLTFPVGTTTQQVQVLVSGDKQRERTETFKVRLFNAIGADIEYPTGIGTIRNDDRR